MQPLLRVKNKKNEYVYFETKDARPCRICKPIDPDYKEGCRAFEVTAAQFEEFKLNTRVFTDCLQNLQEWVQVR